MLRQPQIPTEIVGIPTLKKSVRCLQLKEKQLTITKPQVMGKL